MRIVYIAAALHLAKAVKPPVLAARGIIPPHVERVLAKMESRFASLCFVCFIFFADFIFKIAACHVMVKSLVALYLFIFSHRRLFYNLIFCTYCSSPV